MKLKVNMDITFEVSEERAKEILSDYNKSPLLMTLYGGNNAERPDLGKWYAEGEYSIEEKFFGVV